MGGTREGFGVTCRTWVESSPEVAFQAWSDPRLLEVWMAHRESGGDGTPRLVAVRNVQVAPDVGAPFRVDMITREADGSERVWEHRGEVVEAVPPSRLALTWISEGTEHESTLLELSFTPSDGGTEVELRHSGFRTRKMADGHAEGWDIFLDLFTEAMVSAITAGIKLGAAELKRRLAARAAARAAEGETETA